MPVDATGGMPLKVWQIIFARLLLLIHHLSARFQLRSFVFVMVQTCFMVIGPIEDGFGVVHKSQDEAKGKEQGGVRQIRFL